MKDVFESVIFGFTEILNWDIMKVILIVGALVSAVWIGIGYMLWDPLVAIGSRILEFVPFSMVRSNGAWMLSSFLWLQAVLITFALFFAFFGNLVVKSVSKDKYTSFSIFVAMGSAVLWTVVWFFEGDYIYHQFLRLLTWLPFETVESGIAYLIAFYLIYNAIIVTMVFLVSFYSEPIIEAVESRHFAEDEVRRDHTFSTVGYTLRDTAIFTVISLLAFPIIFIPVANILLQIVLWIWLIKDTLAYDAVSLLYEKADKKKLKEHRTAIWFISFVTTLFNFIPVFNIFGPFFGEVTMYHYLKLERERGKK